MDPLPMSKPGVPPSSSLPFRELSMMNGLLAVDGPTPGQFVMDLFHF